MPRGELSALLTATYSVLPSADSAGALFIATFSIAAIAGRVAAPTQMPVPSGADAGDAADEPGRIGAGHLEAEEHVAAANRR